MSEQPDIPDMTVPDAPDFKLTGVDDSPVSLSDYRGKKHVVLVFNRGFS